MEPKDHSRTRVGEVAWLAWVVLAVALIVFETFSAVARQLREEPALAPAVSASESAAPRVPVSPEHATGEDGLTEKR